MTILPAQVDVAIVGAGPTGLALAIGLAQRGVGFVILDALPEAHNTSRAVVIHAGTLEALELLEIVERMIAQGIKVQNFRIRDRSKILLWADFSVLKSSTRYTLMIPQDESEAILVQVHHKLADRFRTRHVLLMGDAAHVHSPAGGQGSPHRCPQLTSLKS